MNKEFDNGAEGTELELEQGYNESRVYELGFHLDSELPSEEVKKTYQSLRDVVAKAGTVIAEGEPTKVQLAYTISRSEQTGRRDFNTAFFCWIAYETAGEGHQAILEAVKAEKRVIRFLDIRTTVEAAKHSAELAEVYAKAAAEPNDAMIQEEEVSDVELDAALKEAGAA
ncbi:MAG: 30S ribosomal protein S6 [Bacillota bacterium]